MDIEEELDYEGPLFSDDPYLNSLDSPTGNVEHTVSFPSDVDVDLESTGNLRLNEGDQEWSITIENVDGHLAPGGLQNPTGLATKSVLPHQAQEFRNFQSSSSECSEATVVPGPPQLEGGTQTVRIDPLFLFPLDSNSLDFTSDKRRTSDLGGSVGSDHLPLLDTSPKTDLRSILKIKEKRGCCFKIVDKCLSVLCTIPSSSVLVYSAKLVFNDACFHSFFMGECRRRECLKDHHRIPDINGWDINTIWLVSQYMIFESLKPKIEILKIVVQYFSHNCDTTRTLAMAKCLKKLTHAEKIEFSQYLVNHLIYATDRKTAVMWVLFITFSDLSSDEYNALMEGLGVFEESSIAYLDLFDFLNFRAHSLPPRFVSKIIDDILICHLPLKNEDVAGPIIGFLSRLSEGEKENMDTTILQFTIKFDIRSLDDPRLTPSEVPDKPDQMFPRDTRKSVKFAENIDRVRIFDPNLTVAPDVDDIENFVDVLDNLNEGQDALNDGQDAQCDANDCAINEYSVNSTKLFNNLCQDGILNGDCQKPTCSATHVFNEDTFKSVPIKEINLAAEFVINNSSHPTIPVLEMFVNVLSASRELNTLLKFRKCVSKLSAADSSRLTILILSRLARHVERWEAIEMVLTPNLLDIGNKTEDLFMLDSKLLKTVMTEAIMKKCSLLRCVSNEILRRVSLLPSTERENMIEISLTFFRKFILNQRKPLLCPDLISTESMGISKFSSEFETELHKGSSNGYFVVCMMLKLVVEGEKAQREEALDILYSFLTIQFSRTRIFEDILENCYYFMTPTRKSIFELLGNAGLCVILRMLEDGQIAEASGMFKVLRKFRVNLFELNHKFFEVSPVELALIFCSLTVDCDDHTEAVELFLNHCLPSFIDDPSPGSSIVGQLNALTEKMFRKFNSTLLWCEALSLFNGIFLRQKSLLYPSNILKFYETTIRITQAMPWDREAREACLKLFLEIEDSGEHVELQKATYRSVLLTGVKEKIVSRKNQYPYKLQNILHPLVKKLLAICIKVGAYSQFDSTGDRICLNSSMTEDELKVYLVWWVYQLIRARKRAKIYLFGSVCLEIKQDLIADELGLPVHFTIQHVDTTTNDCGRRLFKVVKSLVIAPMFESMFVRLENNTFKIGPDAVREIAQVVVRCFLYYRSDDPKNSQDMCTFCFDDHQILFDS